MNVINMLFIYLISIGIVNVDYGESKINIYSAEIQYNDIIIYLEGNAVYYQFPAIFSIYLDESRSFRCSIQIRGQIENMKQYLFGTELNNQSGIVCVRNDQQLRERMASHQGSLIITNIEDDLIYGEIEARLIGAISEIEYILNGRFVSVPGSK